MEPQETLVLQTIVRHREALYAIKGLCQTKLEVLGFAFEFSLQKNLFFTVYDVQKYYPHTNGGQVRRSVMDLLKSQLIQKFSGGTKNNPAYYAITPLGKKALAEYTSIILNSE